VRIGAMLSDVFPSLFKRPVTENYPFERKPTPERLRGKLRWDASKCTGCQLCVRDCPSEAVEMTIIDRAAKQFEMRYFVDRCTFCGQCVQNCRFNCLELSHDDWELASVNRATFESCLGKG
jgi:formate hydrogenlyase subunit 6/NADH:ubiquinone oxidoreductase subunit I